MSSVCNYCSSVLPSEVLVNASLNKTRLKNVNHKIFLLNCVQSTLLIRSILLIKTFKSRTKVLYKRYLFNNVYYFLSRVSFSIETGAKYCHPQQNLLRQIDYLSFHGNIQDVCTLYSIFTKKTLVKTSIAWEGDGKKGIMASVKVLLIFVNFI